MTRPYPPDEALQPHPSVFIPAPELEAWARDTFIAEEALLSNPDHFHLNQADLGFLWTNEENSRQQRMIIGQCEKMPPQAMGKWQKARILSMIEGWFGDVPDFVITIYAPTAQTMDDASFMALIEHELLHAAQDVDKFGQPKFNKQTGKPAFAIRGHDVSEFVSVVRRYGADAAGVREMVSAANKGPEIAAASIAQACGNCLRLVKG